MKICWFKINVSNMDKSINFYEEILGQKLEKRFSPTKATEIAFLGNDKVKIELIKSTEQAVAKATEGLSFGFQCDDINKVMDLINKKGLTAESDILKPNPTTSFFYLRDPDGIQIQIIEMK